MNQSNRFSPPTNIYVYFSIIPSILHCMSKLTGRDFTIYSTVSLKAFQKNGQKILSKSVSLITPCELIAAMSSLTNRDVIHH